MPTITERIRNIASGITRYHPNIEPKLAEERINALCDQLDALMKPKMAPVQGYAAGIPWAMHLEAYDAYCKRYGAQPALIDLEVKNCRGGFGTRELDAFIPGWRERLSETAALQVEVKRLRRALEDIASEENRSGDELFAAMQEHARGVLGLPDPPMEFRSYGDDPLL